MHDGDVCACDLWSFLVVCESEVVVVGGDKIVSVSSKKFDDVMLSLGFKDESGSTNDALESLTRRGTSRATVGPNPCAGVGGSGGGE